MEKNKSLIIIFVGIVISILLFTIIKVSSFKIKELKFEDIYSTVQNSDYSILYTKDINNEIKSKLKSFRRTYKYDCFYSNMTLDDINIITKSNSITAESDDILILFVSGKPTAIFRSDITSEDLEIQLDKYIFNIIPKSEIKYTVPVTAAEYIQKINKNEYVVSVFGAESCTYCNLYLPVINDLATKYKFDYYYIDKDNFEAVEYEKITELDFTIPEKCTTNGKETTMLKGFAKPMTIITKQGKFVDCIKGYVPESEVTDLLKEYKIIKEK